MSRIAASDKLPLVTRDSSGRWGWFSNWKKAITSDIETALASDQALMVQYYPLEQMCVRPDRGIINSFVSIRWRRGANY